MSAFSIYLLNAMNDLKFLCAFLIILFPLFIIIGFAIWDDTIGFDDRQGASRKLFKIVISAEVIFILGFVLLPSHSTTLSVLNEITCTKGETK